MQTSVTVDGCCLLVAKKGICQNAVNNGVLAYTLLGDTRGYRSQYKKAFDTFMRKAQTKARRSVLPVSDFVAYKARELKKTKKKP